MKIPWGPIQSRRAVVLSIFIVSFVFLTVSSYTQKSGTWDEPFHLASGYAELKYGNYRIDVQHPPFLRKWCALPLLAMNEVRFETNAADLAKGWDYKFAKDFLYRQNDPDRLLTRARFMTVILGVLLGILLFGWANELFGFRAAAGVLALYTLEPNILAHSCLVTTDLGVTCFIFGTLYFLWRTTRKLSAGNFVGFTLFFALSIVSKFSSATLIPIVLMLLVVHVARKSGWPVALGRSGELVSRTLKATIAATMVVITLLISWLAIWTAYGFQYPLYVAHQKNQEVRFQVSQPAPGHAQLLTAALAWLDEHRILPNACTTGFDTMREHAEKRRTFFAGKYSTEGWWYFFPMVFLIKASSVLVVLAAAGLVLSLLRRDALSLDGLFLWFPLFLFLGVTMSSKLQIGLRHILPIFPFALLLAGRALSELLRDTVSQPTPMARHHVPINFRKMVLIGLGLVVISEFAMTYPHYLASFNLFIGGPQNGYKYLADSNLDWGQDLKLLKRWMDKNGVQHINLSYYGTADPAYYGITNCTYLPSPYHVNDAAGPVLPGFVAVSVSNLQGMPSQDIADLYRPLLERRPDAIIGYSIHVYWLEKPWWKEQ